MAPKSQAAAEARLSLSKVEEAFKSVEAKLREELARVQRDTAELARLNLVVQEAAARGTLRKLEAGDAESGGLQRRIEKHRAKQTAAEAQIANADQRALEMDNVARMLRGNLQVHNLGEKVAGLETQLEAMRQALKALAETQAVGPGGRKLRALDSCEREKSKLLQARAENKGKAATVERQSMDLGAKLKEPNYRGVAERTRKKRVELETTSMAVEDLERYWSALDKALLRFHGQKISEINRIIQELWQRTYMGEDIEGIEIVSGEEGGSSRANRSYNYRVVMRKGDALLDMRGRCSAGQRVLACIVIRLALAETFCLSCGILTLDEPTTNLDEYNKSGLATALAEIISARAKQRNFQLLCITHDADFVTHMRDAFNALGADRTFNLPEFYWRISRQQTGTNGQYCSQIHRTDWDDM
mmetsp:Transcript_10827/g.25333  ORF Transcript_10827/g.25333 Transcript_10827/m.25333 type:complete len:417 (-) Transcript_10827:261-1511(-)